MEILALIPARSGSKSVIDKNIREVAGKPMLAWSVEHAKASKRINRVIVSTDSEKYAQIAREAGAEVPFLRPAEYATDTALDLDVFKHALNWLADNENYHPDIIVQLRPTYPKRDPADIDVMVDMLIANPEADSVRSVALAGEVPYKMWLKSCDIHAGSPIDTNAENNRISGSLAEVTEKTSDGSAPGIQSGRCMLLSPLIKDIPECYNMPRQELPTVYYQNACIDVMRASTVLKKNSMTGDRILGYLMSENYDIDTEIELLRAENSLLRKKLEGINK